MHSKDQPVYPMRVACDLTGLSERQIRYYDTTELVSPRRTSGGHRLYSQHDIERLSLVARLIARGMNVEQVRQRLLEEDRKPHRLPEMGDSSFRTMRPHPSYGVSYGIGARHEKPDESSRIRNRSGEWKNK